jgi:hypothetical protein
MDKLTADLWAAWWESGDKDAARVLAAAVPEQDRNFPP